MPIWDINVVYCAYINKLSSIARKKIIQTAIPLAFESIRQPELFADLFHFSPFFYLKNIHKSLLGLQLHC